MPVFARDILDTGTLGLGLLRAAPAAGALVVSFAISRRGLPVPVGRALFAGLILFGLTTILFGLSRSMPLSLAVARRTGCRGFAQRGDPQHGGAIADARRACVAASAPSIRCLSARRTSSASSNLAIAAAALGTVPAVVAGGAVTLVVALLVDAPVPDGCAACRP